MTKYQIWGIHLLQAFFDALEKDQLLDFLKSDEVERFLHAAKTGGSLAGKIPDGDPGSKFPGTGVKDVLDVLDGIFHSVASGLGEIDRTSGVDLATTDGDHTTTTTDAQGHRVTTTTDARGNVTTITTDAQGNITVMVNNSNGSGEGFSLNDDGSSSGNRHDGAGNGTYWSIAPDKAGVTGAGFTATGGDHWTRHYRADGTIKSPGEDGGDTNGGRNPLSSVETLGPQSIQQMVSQMQHPDKDSENLDPNSGVSGIKLTQAEQERLKRIVPAMEALDPNSGIDPLTQLNLDPNKLNTGNKNDDELDPNNGRKPVHNLSKVK